MAALRTLDDETQRELDATRAQHARLKHGVAALVREGEPADSSYLRKLGWQLDACVRWIDRLTTTKEASA